MNFFGQTAVRVRFFILKLPFTLTKTKGLPLCMEDVLMAGGRIGK
jgi:hypothetical protein